VFSSPPHQCATARAKSTVPEGSPKTDAHAGALGLAVGAPEPAAIDVELAPSRLAVASRHRRPLHPKVSELRSPCHHDAVGEDLVEFGEPKHR
jgi:hypothetical protein